VRLELPAGLDGHRRRIRRGGYPSRQAALAVLARLRTPRPGDTGARVLTVGDWLAHWLVARTATYGLRAWLSTSSMVSDRTRRFARWSAIGSLLLGMAGQVAYHLLAQDRVAHAPWGVTTAVSCLPGLVLGMGAALAHMLRADAHLLSQHGQDKSMTRTGGAGPDRSADTIPGHRMAEAEAVAQRLIAAGERVSRRSLRRAGLHGSNADLGVLARMVKPEPLRTPCQGQASQRQTADPVIMPLTGL